MHVDSPLPFIDLLLLFFYATDFLGIGKTTALPPEHWYMTGLCYQFEHPGSDDKTLSWKPLPLQSASHPTLTDLELNQDPCALLELLPEGCCGQQLYFSIYVDLLMWLHPCCTDSVAISTQLNASPSMVQAGLLHWSSLPGQTSRVCVYPWAKVTNAPCKWEVVAAGKKKKISSCMLVHSIIWHSLSHFTAYVWTSLPHHINKTRYICFPVSYINNSLAEIRTHPLKYIATHIWFLLKVLLWKSDF